MKWYYVLSVFLLLFDQLTKHIVRTNLHLYQSIQLLPILAISYTTNTGIVFGWFRGRNEVFIVVVTIVLILLISAARDIVREFKTLGRIALCLIFSGGVGNLIDRIFFGEVVDFIDIQWNYKNIWPVFNFADSYVFIGIWMLVIKYIIGKFRR
ncbi:MAG: signal peptidase II [Endomicrobia bacterium]|nr:signal peptidase II [Endomicrobiia bacterium]MCX7941299.1 signal peptidase II [Endomicrobiia bacterium]MDW8055945.1 signal peptidase II [Elusimicrobiota bacterium]